MRATLGGTVLFSRRFSKVTLFSLGTAAALVVFAPQAEAAQLKVPSQYATIQLAIDNASPGDKIKVAPGTYFEQVIIDKALTVEGSGGKNKTIIDGSLTPVLLLSGQVRITANGDVKFSGFTVQKAGATAGGNRMSIFAAGPSPGPMTYTISDNTILGSTDPTDSGDYGFYTQNAYDTLVFTHNEISQTGSNPIVLERHYGASDVSHNTFDRGVADGSVDAYFSMNYGGPDITSLQQVSHNKIDMGYGTTFDYAHRGFAITFAGAFTGAAGGFTQVQVEHNDIGNLKPYRRGVGFWNNASPTDGGDITGVISHNKISGTAGDVTETIGVRLLGLIADAVVEHNDLKKLDIGILLQNWNGGNGTGADISNNHMDVVLGLEAQSGASTNQVTKNKIDASNVLSYTVTLAAGTSLNAVTRNHLKANTETGDATVQDFGVGNEVSDNK